MALRSITSAIARKRPRCTAWFSSTPLPSSPQAEDAAGADLPQFVKDEFDAFFECGILAHGFLRLRAGTLDRSDELAVVAHIWVKREQPWLKLPADVPAWPEGAPVAELVQALSSGPRDR